MTNRRFILDETVGDSRKTSNIRDPAASWAMQIRSSTAISRILQEEWWIRIANNKPSTSYLSTTNWFNGSGNFNRDCSSKLPGTKGLGVSARLFLPRSLIDSNSSVVWFARTFWYSWKSQAKNWAFQKDNQLLRAWEWVCKALGVYSRPWSRRQQVQAKNLSDRQSCLGFNENETPTWGREVNLDAFRIAALSTAALITPVRAKSAKKGSSMAPLSRLTKNVRISLLQVPSSSCNAPSSWLSETRSSVLATT